MKKILTYAALSIFIAGCQKGPQADDSTPPIDPSKSYSIRVTLPDQVVRTSVENNRLKLDHYARVHILVDPVEYSRSWAIMVEEDWQGTNLHNLDFTCLNEFGTYAFNWRASNLNFVNPGQKTVIDTTVDGQRLKKIKLERIFHFYKDYPNQQQAIDKMNALQQITSDVGKFRAFYTYGGVNSLPNVANSNLKYTR